ncbi:MAG: HU family DNA-binding protein [Syntrophales bacterium]
MTQSELITILMEKENLTHKDAVAVVKLIFDGFVTAMKTGERIEIRGFGNFVIRNYGSYAGRNPKTGLIVDVHPKRLPYFKVGKELKERIKNIEVGGIE